MTIQSYLFDKTIKNKNNLKLIAKQNIVQLIIFVLVSEILRIQQLISRLLIQNQLPEDLFKMVFKNFVKEHEHISNSRKTRLRYEPNWLISTKVWLISTPMKN